MRTSDGQISTSFRLPIVELCQNLGITSVLNFSTQTSRDDQLIFTQYSAQNSTTDNLSGLEAVFSSQNTSKNRHFEISFQDVESRGEMWKGVQRISTFLSTRNKGLKAYRAGSPNFTSIKDQNLDQTLTAMNHLGRWEMARINIEEEAWQRFYRMAELTGRTVQECVGIVACLWHQSQGILKTTGTKEEVIEWSGLFKFSESDRENLFLGLKKSRFISEEKNELFLVHGNEIQIENRVSRQHKAAKAAKAIQKKWKTEKTQRALSKKSPRVPQELSESLSAMQFNAMQFSAVQCNSEQSNAVQILNTQNSENSKNAIAQKTKSFIAGYCSRFKIRYGTAPEIQGKDAGIAKRIVKNLSEEKIEIYLDAFFSMPDAWLVKIKHPIHAFESKMNEVVVYANSGVFTSSRQMHQADDMVANMALLEKVRKENA